MNREKFIDAATEYENDHFVVTIYNGDEIYGRFKMNTVSIEEYDDEIVIYGDDNDFVILPDETIEIVAMDDGDEIEFLFGSGDQKIGITFPQQSECSHDI